MSDWYSGLTPQAVPFSQNYESLKKRHKQVPAKHLTSAAFYMYQRYLLQKAMSVFDWKLPDSWDREYLLYSLYCFGSVAQFNHSGYGNIIQTCGFEGYDIYYRPTRAIITNPVITSPIYRDIVKDWNNNDPETSCIIWHLTPDYCGIMDLVTYFAGLMSNISGAIDANAYNTRVAYLFVAQKGKNTAESLKEIYDLVSEGNPAVFIDKDLFDEDGKPLYEMLGENVKETYIIDKLLNDLATIDDMFSQEIGIPNANTQKKERMITDEVNANNFETRSKCELWLDDLRKCMELSRQLFGEENTPKIDWRKDLQTRPDPISQTVQRI